VTVFGTLTVVRRGAGRYHVCREDRDGAQVVIATIRKRITGKWGWSGVGPMHMPGESHVCPTRREALHEVAAAANRA
jgi:hypothetical protein